MNDDSIRKLIADNYEDSTEDTIRSMVSDFYSKKMLSTTILVWAMGLAFCALAVVSAVQFFKADQTKEQILYAALFLVGLQMLGLMKVFAWGMVHRHGIKRAIKRLELRIAEMNETLRSKQQ